MPSRRVAWWVFAGLLLIWTAALVMPVPGGGRVAGLDVRGLKFYFAKCLHIGAYAFFTVLIARIASSRSPGLIGLAVVSCHAFAGEGLQALTSHRGPSLRDVLLDHLGIVLGVTVTLPRWRELWRGDAPTEPDL